MGWVELSGNSGMFDTSWQRVSPPYKLIGLIGQGFKSAADDVKIILYLFVVAIFVTI